MIHPNTEVRQVSEKIGLGVFAKRFIPKGTMIYVKDSLEIEVDDAHYASHSKTMQDVIEKFSYIDERGFRILSWDIAKYVNHNCGRNTISTGYGFEIALRDIQPGEEITDEYGIFNLDYSFPCGCGAKNCRATIHPEDLDNLADVWDAEIKDALVQLYKVEQPLIGLLDEATRKDLEALDADPSKFKSIRNLRCAQKVLAKK